MVVQAVIDYHSLDDRGLQQFDFVNQHVRFILSIDCLILYLYT